MTVPYWIKSIYFIDLVVASNRRLASHHLLIYSFSPCALCYFINNITTALKLHVIFLNGINYNTNCSFIRKFIHKMETRIFQFRSKQRRTCQLFKYASALPRAAFLIYYYYAE